MAKDPKTGLKRITYTRSYLATKELPVLVCGDLGFANDLELLLEDSWKNLTVANSEKEFLEAFSTRNPVLVVIDSPCFNIPANKLIEPYISGNVSFLVIARSGKDELLNARLQRDLLRIGIPFLKVSKESAEAARELDELLRDWSSLGKFSNDSDRELILTAFKGFELAHSAVKQLHTLDVDSILTLGKYLLSHVRLESTQLEAALALLETYRMWVNTRTSANEIGQAYRRLESKLKDTSVLNIIHVAVGASDQFAKKTLTEESWIKLIEQNGLPKLTARLLSTKFESVAEFVKKQNKNKLRSIG